MSVAREKNGVFSNLTEQVRLPELLTTKQLAELLNTHPSTIKKSRSSGLLFGRPAPIHLKIGERKTVYRSSDILDWLNSAPARRVSNS